jgi:hypothetical protein
MDGASRVPALESQTITPTMVQASANLVRFGCQCGEARLLVALLPICLLSVDHAARDEQEAQNTPIEWWEYLCWIGFWDLLATTDCHDGRSFKSTNDGNDPRFKGAPFRLNNLMSRTRFEDILEISSYFIYKRNSVIVTLQCNFYDLAMRHM